MYSKFHFISHSCYKFIEIYTIFYISALPSTLSQKSTFDSLSPYISQNNIEAWLTQFSSFYNRYYKSEYGLEAADWLFAQVDALRETASSKVNVTVRKFTHSFAQYSTIARIEPANFTPSSDVVILSAHMDSINQNSPINGKAPGADDDGSTSIFSFF